MIVDSSGSREIATIERRVVGEFDQTPQSWRCSSCEAINKFDDDAGLNTFLAPKAPEYQSDLRCSTCTKPFTEDSWVVSPFCIYLGTWNGKAVAEGGPWHWSLDWHRDFARDDHSKDDCYAAGKSGRPRQANPCITRHLSPKPRAKKLPVPALFVDVAYDHSLPPPSSGLTPFPETPYTPYRRMYGYADDDRSFDPELLHETWSARDSRTVDSGGFTIEYYRNDNEAGGRKRTKGLDVLYEEPDLGSYYDAPASEESSHKDEPRKRHTSSGGQSSAESGAYQYADYYLEDGRSQESQSPPSENSLLDAYQEREGSTTGGSGVSPRKTPSPSPVPQTQKDDGEANQKVADTQEHPADSENATTPVECLKPPSTTEERTPEEKPKLLLDGDILLGRESTHKDEEKHSPHRVTSGTDTESGENEEESDDGDRNDLQLGDSIKDSPAAAEPKTPTNLDTHGTTAFSPSALTHDLGWDADDEDEDPVDHADHQDPTRQEGDVISDRSSEVDEVSEDGEDRARSSGRESTGSGYPYLVVRAESSGSEYEDAVSDNDSREGETSDTASEAEDTNGTEEDLPRTKGGSAEVDVVNCEDNERGFNLDVVNRESGSSGASDSEDIQSRYDEGVSDCEGVETETLESVESQQAKELIESPSAKQNDHQSTTVFGTLERTANKDYPVDSKFDSALEDSESDIDGESHHKGDRELSDTNDEQPAAESEFSSGSGNECGHQSDGKPSPDRGKWSPGSQRGSCEIAEGDIEGFHESPAAKIPFDGRSPSVHESPFSDPVSEEDEVPHEMSSENRLSRNVREPPLPHSLPFESPSSDGLSQSPEPSSDDDSTSLQSEPGDQAHHSADDSGNIKTPSDAVDTSDPALSGHTPLDGDALAPNACEEQFLAYGQDTDHSKDDSSDEDIRDALQNPARDRSSLAGVCNGLERAPESSGEPRLVASLDSVPVSDGAGRKSDMTELSLESRKPLSFRSTMSPRPPPTPPPDDGDDCSPTSPAAHRAGAQHRPITPPLSDQTASLPSTPASQNDVQVDDGCGPIDAPCEDNLGRGPLVQIGLILKSPLENSEKGSTPGAIPNREQRSEADTDLKRLPEDDPSRQRTLKKESKEESGFEATIRRESVSDDDDDQEVPFCYNPNEAPRPQVYFSPPSVHGLLNQGPPVRDDQEQPLPREEAPSPKPISAGDLHQGPKLGDELDQGQPDEGIRGRETRSEDLSKQSDSGQQECRQQGHTLSQLKQNEYNCSTRERPLHNIGLPKAPAPQVRDFATQPSRSSPPQKISIPELQQQGYPHAETAQYAPAGARPGPPEQQHPTPNYSRGHLPYRADGPKETSRSADRHLEHHDSNAGGNIHQVKELRLELRDKQNPEDVKAHDPVTLGYQNTETRHGRNQAVRFGEQGHDIAGTEASAHGPTEQPRKQGFVARIFGFLSGLFGRGKETAPKNQPRSQGKPGFLSRIFGGWRKHKPENDDIELGAMSYRTRETQSRPLGPGATENDVPPELESAARLEDISIRDQGKYANLRVDVHSQTRKRDLDGLGLYQPTLAGRGNGDGPGRSGMERGLGGLSPPQAARKMPVKVRYAPTTPSEAMCQHVSGPRERRRGDGGTAAAAVNPGNWFWMDVYWK